MSPAAFSSPASALHIHCRVSDRTCPAAALQNTTSDLKQTVVNFKDSAMRELRPVTDEVEAAAERLSNTTVRVVSDGVSGVVSFGNNTWHAITDESAALGPAVQASAGKPDPVLSLSITVFMLTEHNQCCPLQAVPRIL